MKENCIKQNVSSKVESALTRIAEKEDANWEQIAF